MWTVQNRESLGLLSFPVMIAMVCCAHRWAAVVECLFFFPRCFLFTCLLDHVARYLGGVGGCRCACLFLCLVAVCAHSESGPYFFPSAPTSPATCHTWKRQWTDCLKDMTFACGRTLEVMLHLFFFFSTCNPYLVLLSCRRYMSKKLEGEACHFHKRALRPMLWPNTRARTHTLTFTHTPDP